MKSIQPMNQISNSAFLKGRPSYLLSGFIYGSLVVLLICLGTTALVFSNIYFSKEQARAQDSAALISHFFASEYHTITEDAYLQNYSDIQIRIDQVAHQLEQTAYTLVVAAPDGKCLYQGQEGVDTAVTETCQVPAALKNQIPEFKPDSTAHVLQFDYNLKRYIYMVPLYANAVLVGYLYVSISDPYEFSHANALVVAFQTFAIPIFGILLVWGIWLYISHHLILKPYLSSLVGMEKKQAVAEIAGQVAHNIRAPLVVIHSLLRDTKNLDVTEKKLLVSAASRIETITDDLMKHFIVKKTDSESRSFCFLGSVVDSVVAETIVLLKDHAQIEFKSNINESLYSVCLPLAATDFVCVLSNMVNNSIHALNQATSQNLGLITISAELTTNQQLILTLEDNGHGIPQEILEKLNSIGGSYGKVGGAGLGLKHAKETLLKVGGALSLESTMGVGTRVTLRLPVTSTPKWYTNRLDLSDAEKIVVLEDDPSMLLLWKQRLGDLQVTYLTDPDQFDIERFPKETSCYLFDYEIGESSTTGLDLILTHDLRDKAVLVTSYFDDPGIQSKVEESSTYMIPKFMVTQIDILLPKDKKSSLKRPKYDLILIDDDLMVHELWHFQAQKQGKNIRAVQSVSELELSELNREMPFYIDKNLGEGICGIDMAKELYSLGFVHLYLATGDERILDTPRFIKKIVSKKFPAHMWLV